MTTAEMTTADEISFEDFHKVQMHVGTVLTAEENTKARNPAYVITIDFGPEIGVKTSSAQITERYTPEQLIGSQVIAVTNFPPKRVAGIKSEVLVLAGVCSESGTTLLSLTHEVTNGTRVL
jgi:tRNA-binding protein